MSENIVATQIIEQARSWKARALAAEDALELAREQARYRESELVRSGHQQLLEAQANALDTIQRIAAQLPTEPIIDAKVVVPDVEVDTWFGEDDTPVVQIDTHRGHGRLRINLNDGVVWDGDPETDERPGKNAELIEWEQRALAQAETISRQLDTIRDQAEKIEQLEEQLRLAVQHGVEHEARTREAEDKAETLARRMDHNVRSFRALEARKVELEAEVLAERGALATCQTKLTGQEERAAIAEERADELLMKLDQSERLSASRRESIEALQGQIVAHGEAAHLRDLEVHKLARLWESMSDSWRTNVGYVLNRQLIRVFADHGVDTEKLPAFPKSDPTPSHEQQLVTEHAQLARAASQLAALTLGQPVSGSPRPADLARHVLRIARHDASAATEQPVTDRILREYNHLRGIAEQVSEFAGRAPKVYPFKLRSLIADMRDALKNGAPDPTPDIADCA